MPEPDLLLLKEEGGSESEDIPEITDPLLISGEVKRGKQKADGTVDVSVHFTINCDCC